MKIKQALWLVTVFCASISIAQANNCSKENWAPDSRYTIKNDIVLDNETGLEWKRCPEGLNWNGSACTGVPLEISWNDAIATYPKEGASWRLPTQDELATLFIREVSFHAIQKSDCDTPAINTLAFPGEANMWVFWSSETHHYENSAKLVISGLGTVSEFDRNKKFILRLVRTASSVEYNVNNDGTVYDPKTNLTWMRCRIGQTWDGQNCNGQAEEVDYKELLSKSKLTLAGYDDWRVPTAEELMSLATCPRALDYTHLPSGKRVSAGQCSNGSQLDTVAFPNSPSTDDDYFWTSTQTTPYERVVFNRSFFEKEASTFSSNFLRLVRGSVNQNATQLMTAESKQNSASYAINPNGTVYDKGANLTWMRCSIGQKWDGTTCVGKPTLLTWEEAMQQAKDGWQLPTAEQLDSLVYCSGDKPRSSARPDGRYLLASNGRCEGYFLKPTVDQLIFPTQNYSYWSSTVYSNASGAAWNVSFKDGAVQPDKMNNRAYVRLVQPGVSSTISSSDISANQEMSATIKNGQYIVSSDGTVFDTETNLTWMRCSIGQTWKNRTCIGEAERFSWDAALKLQQNFAGANDWRLPTADELSSLVYCSKGRKRSERPNGNYVRDTNGECLGENYQQPVTDLSVFPNAVTSEYRSSYWSSSPYAYHSSLAWLVDFSKGFVGRYYKDSSNHVRLVRAGSNPSTPKPAFSSSEQKEPPATVNKYVVNPNGTVYDKETNLTWMRCSVGQEWDGKSCIGQAKKFNWNDSVTMKYSFADYSDWRLPSVEELDSLVECSDGRKKSERPDNRFVLSSNGACLGQKYRQPTIDPQRFPNTLKNGYWSSSKSFTNAGEVWSVNFKHGVVSSGTGSFELPVRLVRVGF
ncbi:hypothetical protein BOO24_01395 [Vibrio navarrensis]|uniref:Lcl C-terminal domain-containing protein n=1 Tax=Vibrio navarrensis TaxID=29495 RepID=UPI00186A8340|nr:DUF1566 domain-containing protein [Vibrio navarrensis]MBE4591013.1 hypothetical protein [Vibrio navarrensis]